MLSSHTRSCSQSTTKIKEKSKVENDNHNTSLTALIGEISIKKRGSTSNNTHACTYTHSKKVEKVKFKSYQ